MIQKVGAPIRCLVCEIVVGEPAVFEHHYDGDRVVRRTERRDDLRLALVQDPKVLFLKTCENVSVLIGHENIQDHKIGLNSNGVRSRILLTVRWGTWLLRPRLQRVFGLCKLDPWHLGFCCQHEKSRLQEVERKNQASWSFHLHGIAAQRYPSFRSCRGGASMRERNCVIVAVRTAEWIGGIQNPMIPITP